MRSSLILVLGAVAGLLASVVVAPIVGIYAMPFCLAVAAGARLAFFRTTPALD